MKYEGPAEDQFAKLLATLGIDAGAIDSTVRLDGPLPVLNSPHQVSLSGGLALAAQGAATAALWEQRGGGAQEVRVDGREVVFTLNPLSSLRRNGHPAVQFRELANPGYFTTRDGRQLFITAQYPGLRSGTLRLLGTSNDPAAEAAAVARYDGEEIEQAFIDAGLTAALVRTREEWEQHPHAQVLAQQPVVEIERIGDADPVLLAPAARPLDGVRVAELTHVFAGPMLSRGLAEQGADVLNLSTIRPELADNLSLTIATGIGKRSAICDFAEGGAEELTRLLRDADVFVQCWRPGFVEEAGFGPDQVAAIRPGIVYVSISCFGHEGPWRHRKGFDPMAQATTGMTADEARHDTYKFTPPGILTDGIAAYLGAAAVESALARRAIEGGSWHVKISLTRMAMWIQSLGYQPEGFVPDTDLGAPDVWRMDTPYGHLEYVAPAIRYSRTAAHFDKPPVPVGASLPEWLPLP